VRAAEVAAWLKSGEFLASVADSLVVMVMHGHFIDQLQKEMVCDYLQMDFVLAFFSFFFLFWWGDIGAGFCFPYATCASYTSAHVRFFN
jgi:hypothetical protein